MRVIRACAWIAGGLGLNYLLKHYSFGHWPDGLLPTLVVVFVMTGVILLICAAFSSEQNCLVPALGFAAVLGLSYGAVSVGFQTIEMGGHLIQDCTGLRNAAASSGDVPQSSSSPGNPAVSCMAARIGVLLEPYTYLEVYGVTSRSAQERVRNNVSAYRDTKHLRPVRIEFYEKENWITWHNDKTGAGGGTRGPERLTRVVTID